MSRATKPTSPAGGRFIVALTGASGALYGLRLLRYLLAAGALVEAVVSPSGRRVLKAETDWRGEPLEAFLHRTYGEAVKRGRLAAHSWADVGATIASGSYPIDAMVVCPCSMGTLSGIVTGSASNLIERAADVTLKEGRPLVLVPRETPMNRIHLENLVRVAEVGARVVPAMPAFYQAPQTFDDLADFLVARIASVLGLAQDLVEPWDPNRLGETRAEREP